MSLTEDVIASPSYFWSCITLSEDCPFYTSIDPNLYYFGIGVLGLYAAFVIMVFSDLCFFWPLDKLHDQADYYLNVVRTKVRRVHVDRRRLLTTKDRIEKQLKRSQSSNLMVSRLRAALTGPDTQSFNALTSNIVEKYTTRSDSMWSDVTSVIDY